MNIELIPAIDLIEGQCVRLAQGDYDRKKVYADKPADVARQFADMGFKRLHVVDLDGAKSRHVGNMAALEAITKTCPTLEVDFGGGIKSDEDIRKAFEHGAAMVTIGSVAVTQPDLFVTWLNTYGADKLILGADVRDGMVSINGWKEESNLDLLSFLEDYVGKGVKKVLCTDISRDGMMRGPAIELYRKVLKAYPSLRLIASGGVSGNEDIERLDAAGIPAVVFGKAFYEGKIDITRLMANQS